MKKDNIRLLYFICLFSASLICLCACRASPTFESPAPTEPAAQWGFGSAEEIVAALCSREMEGRTVGSRGGACAAEYIAGTFEAAGLAPFAGESFLLEYVDQVAEPLAAEPEVTVFAADGTQTQFTPGQDYIYTMPFQDFDMQLPVSGKKAECERQLPIRKHREERENGIASAVPFSHFSIDAVTFDISKAPIPL